MPNIEDSAKSIPLSVVIIVPGVKRRESLVAALSGSGVSIVREFEGYPTDADQPELARLACDVVIVDLDDDEEQALGVIASVCTRNPATTVMAYSARSDATLMRRSMQAGARELLIEPLLPDAVREAFARALVRKPTTKKVPGKILVFMPTKGGVGVTTLASNFALALTLESKARVVVVDLDFQLGEVALGLGMTATFSVLDTLLNPARLDREFLSTILLRHSSGLAILPASEEMVYFNAPAEGGRRLFEVLRDEFDYVVVDSGTCHGFIQETMFRVADVLYLVAEMNFPSLRNGHRLVSFLAREDASRGLEVIINRFNSRNGDIDENNATKALGRPINWRIPNCFAEARAAQDTGVPLAMANSPITRVLSQMAKSACGKPFTSVAPTRKGFSFFGSMLAREPVQS